MQARRAILPKKVVVMNNWEFRRLEKKFRTNLVKQRELANARRRARIAFVVLLCVLAFEWGFLIQRAFFNNGAY